MNAIPIGTRILGALVIFLAGCGYDSQSEDLTPPRPENLPEQAVWRGGLDGGEWYFCERSEESYVCSIYWTKGNLYSRQSFKLCAHLHPSQLFRGSDRSGMTTVNVTEGTVRFVPIGPPELFSYGQPSKELTESARSEFEAQEAHTCPVELVVNEGSSGQAR